MTIKEAFKSFADDQGWSFVYARRDYQNLHDSANFITDALEGVGIGETVLFLDPLRRAKGESGTDEAGFMMILTKSNHDQTYEERFDLYIDPLINIVMNTFYNKLRCSFDINEWRSTEVINMFDWNADGLLINFSTKGYE